jgi:hypothetical protein
MATATLSRRVAPAFLVALLVAGPATACGEGAPEHPPAESASPSPTTSVSPRGPEEFEASVSADEARIRASASAALRDVSGQGNAMADVSQSGVPTSRTKGKRVALVKITNSTQEKAFYAVQVDFVDASGKVVDSVTVGVENVEPGQKVERYAISEKASGAKTFPKIAKAERTG